MKKLGVLFMSLVGMSAAVTSCSNNDNNNSTPATTNLELTIQDITQLSVIADADVVLYGTSADLSANTNPIGTAQKSDANGKVTFKNLEAKVYYFRVTKTTGCLDNIYIAYFTYDPTTSQPTPLVAGKTTSLNVPIIGMGTLTATNNTADSYNLYVRASAKPGGTPGTYQNVATLTTTSPDNSYTVNIPAVGWDVKFVKLDGVTGNEDLTVVVEKLANVVTACGTKTVTNP